MRKMKITKQQTVNPKAVYMGLSIPQVLLMGMNLFKWIFVMFQKPIFRPYESKGALDRYAEDEKKQE